MDRELKPNYANWSPGLLSVLRGTVDRYPTSLMREGDRYIATDPRGRVVIVNLGTLAAEAIMIQLLRDSYTALGTPVHSINYRAFLVHTPDFNSCMLVDGTVPHLRLWQHESVADLLKLFVFQLPIRPHERTRLYEVLARTLPVTTGGPISHQSRDASEHWLLIRLPVTPQHMPPPSTRVTFVARHKLYSEVYTEAPKEKLMNRFADEDGNMAATLAAVQHRIR